MELTGADICKIIKACKDASVRSFKLGDLEIYFAPENTQDAAAPIWHRLSYPDDPTMEFELKPENPPSPVDETQVQNEELDDALLMFEDPTEWQRRELNT